MKIPALLVVSYYFVRVVVSQIFELGRDENEINNTGFGVNRYMCVHRYQTDHSAFTAILKFAMSHVLWP